MNLLYLLIGLKSLYASISFSFSISAGPVLVSQLLALCVWSAWAGSTTWLAPSAHFQTWSGCSPGAPCPAVANRSDPHLQHLASSPTQFSLPCLSMRNPARASVFPRALQSFSIQVSLRPCFGICESFLGLFSRCLLGWRSPPSVSVAALVPESTPSTTVRVE